MPRELFGHSNKNIIFCNFVAMTNTNSRKFTGLALFVLAVVVSLSGCGSKVPSGLPYKELNLVVLPSGEVASFINIYIGQTQFLPMPDGTGIQFRCERVGECTVIGTKNDKPQFTLEGRMQKLRRTSTGIDVYVFGPIQGQEGALERNIKKAEEYLAARKDQP